MARRTSPIVAAISSSPPCTATPRTPSPYFLGYADETGEGEGRGLNVNYPMPSGTPWEVWSAALADSLARIKAYGAEAIVLSLGVDTFEKDPISFFKLKPADYIRMGEMFAASSVPVLTVMEGGYGVDGNRPERGQCAEGPRKLRHGESHL